jgi:hypothetical protein
MPTEMLICFLISHHGRARRRPELARWGLPPAADALSSRGAGRQSQAGTTPEAGARDPGGEGFWSGTSRGRAPSWDRSIEERAKCSKRCRPKLTGPPLSRYKLAQNGPSWASRRPPRCFAADRPPSCSTRREHATTSRATASERAARHSQASLYVVEMPLPANYRQLGFFFVDVTAVVHTYIPGS